jgi:WD40 repeat protein
LGGNHQIAETFFFSSIAWGPDQSNEFVIYYSADNLAELSICHLDSEADSVSRTQFIELENELNQVASSSDFVIGASTDNKIHVWDRRTGEKRPYVLCDVEDDEELDEDEILYPLRMSCHGHILVTTSYLGCALCVWDISTGRLLRRWNDEAEDEHYTDIMQPGDGPDFTSMAYWRQLNGFICTDGYLNIWCFPVNQDQRSSALDIRNRELDISRSMLVDSDDSSSMDDICWIWLVMSL